MMDMVKDLMNEMSYNRWVARNSGTDPISLAMQQRNDLKEQASQDRMSKERMFKDTLSAQRNIAEMANPMSNLSSSERYLNTIQNLKNANTAAKLGLSKARLDNEQSGMMTDYFAQPGNMDKAFNPYGTQNTTVPPSTANTLANPSGIVSNYPKTPGIGTPITEDFIPEDPRTKYFKNAIPQGIFDRLYNYNTR